MNTPFICLLLAALFVVLSKIPVVIAITKQGVAYDNKNPREQQKGLHGVGARAVAAHQNMIESFPIFFAAVMMAYVGQVSASTASILSIVYILARVLYQYFYLANLDLLRTSAWAIGYIACIAMMVLAVI